MAYSEKVLDHYENPRNVGSFGKEEAGVGYRHGWCASLWRCDETADQGRQGWHHRGRQVQDLRLRIGDRLVLARYRVGERQDRRSGAGDQEHANRRGTGAAAGQDPLLDPWRKTQSRLRWRTTRSIAANRKTAFEEKQRWRLRYRKKRPNMLPSYMEKRGKGIGLRLGVRTSGCSGVAYKLEFVDAIEPDDVEFESHRRQGVDRREEPSLPRRDGTRLRA